VFEITYHPKIKDDLERVGKTEFLRIRETIEKKLMTRPQLYGARLRGELREYWKLRVGNYRVVYKIGNKKVFVLMIGHRKEIYKMVEGRN